MLVMVYFTWQSYIRFFQVFFSWDLYCFVYVVLEDFVLKDVVVSIKVQFLFEREFILKLYLSDYRLGIDLDYFKYFVLEVVNFMIFYSYRRRKL